MPVVNVSDPKWDNAVERIEDIICEYQNITREQMKGLSRLPDIVTARHITYFVLKCFTNSTHANIGKRYTAKRLNVRASILKIEEYYEYDKYFHKKLDNILALIKTDSKLQFGKYKNLLPDLND
jgi:chromosomal replication initiation ATPase DnaA